MTYSNVLVGGSLMIEVENKSGKNSHGISKFYSSTSAKVINGVFFFGISLIDTSI